MDLLKNWLKIADDFDNKVPFMASLKSLLEPSEDPKHSEIVRRLFSNLRSPNGFPNPGKDSVSVEWLIKQTELGMAQANEFISPKPPCATVMYTIRRELAGINKYWVRWDKNQSTRLLIPINGSKALEVLPLVAGGIKDVQDLGSKEVG